MTTAWTGMRGIASIPTYVVMQPTTLCNLDCSYCYLPFRSADKRMPVEVATAVAASVNELARDRRFSVVWGIACLSECACQVACAFTLPVATVVWLNYPTKPKDAERPTGLGN